MRDVIRQLVSSVDQAERLDLLEITFDGERVVLSFRQGVPSVEVDDVDRWFAEKNTRATEG